jgi:hypothetical protein
MNDSDKTERSIRFKEAKVFLYDGVEVPWACTVLRNNFTEVCLQQKLRRGLHGNVGKKVGAPPKRQVD